MRPHAAAKVWDKLVALKPTNRRRYIFGYISRYLVTKQEPDQARMVWQKAATLSDLTAYQPSSENLVVNGDFSQEILNGGFDWTYRQSPDVSLTLDPTQFQSGHSSLHLEMDSKGHRRRRDSSNDRRKPKHFLSVLSFF